MAASGNHQQLSGTGWQPRPPLDPCKRMMRHGPIQPMSPERSLLVRLLFG